MGAILTSEVIGTLHEPIFADETHGTVTFKAVVDVLVADLADRAAIDKGTICAGIASCTVSTCQTAMIRASKASIRYRQITPQETRFTHPISTTLRTFGRASHTTKISSQIVAQPTAETIIGVIAGYTARYTLIASEIRQDIESHRAIGTD